VSTNNVETVGKWIELLEAAVPTISRLGVLLDPKGPSAAPVMRQVERSAQALQLRPSWYELTDLDRLAAALSTARAAGSDGLVLLSGGVLGSASHPRIGGELLKARLPAVAEHRGFAVAGGLLAHGPDTAALARRAAGYADKILKGARPGNLPVELPTTYTVVINVKTAQALGLTIPPSVLAQATELIQ
jgi:putative tryptophan/tyrosine transport system substrate-binding protein